MGGKSRLERRKEKRLATKKQKFLSWSQHQKSWKSKGNSTGPALENLKKSKNSINEISKGGVLWSDGDPEVDHDGMESTNLKIPKVELGSLRHPNSVMWKIDKRRKCLKGNMKTKFEEFLDMGMQKGAVSVEEDLKLETKLSKKLKVKEGKLRGVDDGLNLLFEGMPSVLDSLEEDAQTAAGESFGNKSISDKYKKRKSSQQGLGNEVKPKKKMHRREVDVSGNKGELSEQELGVEAAIGVSNPMEACHVEGALENVLDEVTVLEKNAKYVAPHMRSREGDDLGHSQIRRRVRGLLNKLSESNVESITQEMSTIFHSVSRIAGSQIISKEVLASCSGGPRGNEQYAAVFAAFVAGMACLVGIDFSANLVASLAKSFEDEYLEEDNLSLRNLTLLLAYLCIYGVCSSDLIYDFLNMLSKRLSEADVATILTILQCCGVKLRGDDPTAMKNFVFSVQNMVNGLKLSGHGQEKINNKRMEFMLETICDIKNNKKRPKEDPAQHTRIKKWLHKLRVEDISIRGVKWSKLLDPNKKGQWWLSGDLTSARDTVQEVASTIDKEALEAQKMLQLAASQRMNTDSRRAIFCIIMSGEDYIDAFEKLLRLDLPGKQDREIIRVLVECSLQEKMFNKYYTVLASKLCDHDKNHKFTLQYCLWDHFKELESMPLIRLMHLSRFVAEMLSSFTLSLSVLKTVELSDTGLLTPKRIMHFRLLFEALFEYPEKLVWNIFTRVAVIPELEDFRSGLEFFINRYVVGTNKAITEKFRVAKKALNNVEGVLM
ncbi:uncharacterized protein LOC131157992 isoform X2 [Malania oleifera]|uniref:uncharacterized protein LOC131157992 isoform X2 n=2 Tax=Malania oleifera TaxID=397392 RepID=UPI0025AE5EA5|nr:uncharacterized protein LOC131157992 isoform X2 [Malania oleifera]